MFRISFKVIQCWEHSEMGRSGDETKPTFELMIVGRKGMGSCGLLYYFLCVKFFIMKTRQKKPLSLLIFIVLAVYPFLSVF